MTGRGCLFCAIGAGEVPHHRVWADDRIVAFLDIAPIRRGHVQIIPRAHHACFGDIPAPVAAQIIGLGQELARGMKRIYGVRRVAFLFTGGDIPHAHAHLVPMHAPTDITSRRYIAERELTFRDCPPLDPIEAPAIIAELRSALGSAP